MKNKIVKITIIIGIAAVVVLFFVLDLGRYLTLSHIKSQQEALAQFYAQNAMLTIGLYAGVYILVTALSLPGAVIMTLAGGAFFGLGVGVVVISFASSIGATLAFLVSRFLLRDYVQGKFGDKLGAFNKGIERDGAFYLFTLRLVPIFPFFVINLVMGLTPIRTLVYYLVSQIGMLPGTFVYVNAGTQLGKIESASGILSPALLLSFALLGVFPIIAKKLVAFFKSRKALAGHKKPKQFDYNLVVIGAGAAGLVTSYIAAAVKAKVALIEKHKMGGDCLNTGCVPSKALIRSAKILSYARRAGEFGFKRAEIDYAFAEVMDRVQKVVKKVAPHDSAERYTGLGVEVIRGEAHISSPYMVEVDGRTLTTRSIVVATGATPAIPSIAGLENADYLTSDTVWGLRERPEKMVVLGGGPIGSELSQVFARLGVSVTQVEMAPRIMEREDSEVARMITETFESEGIRVLTGHRAKEVRMDGPRKILVCESNGQDVRIEFDQILVAVGRVANTKGFGLEELGVKISDHRTIETNELLQTNFPNIFCAGDVAGPYQFTHTAGHQAWYASVNALFGRFKSFKVDYRVIPWATFTDPEVARVGLNETEAAEKGVAYETAVYPMADLDRAIADSEDHGFVKILTLPGKDKILGVTIVAAHASDIISEYVLAMKQRIGLNKILGTIHIYPTLAEANKYAAGVWKKAHRPATALRWIERYHKWRRGFKNPSAREAAPKTDSDSGRLEKITNTELK